MKNVKVGKTNTTYNITDFGDNSYSLECFLSMPKQDKKTLLGYVRFNIKSNKAWINKISVRASHRRLGIGSQLLERMEIFVKSEGVKIVEGKFYPLGVSENNLRSFYEKNGYFVPNKTRSWEGYDETWTLHKDISKSTVSNKVTDTSKSMK